MSFLDATQGDDQEVVNPNLDLAADEGGYDAPDVQADQDAIQQEVFTELATRVPGWQAHDGNLDTWLIEDFSAVGSEIRALAADVPASIFQTYGTVVLGIPPEVATAAAGAATITATDDAGYTLDTGATFGLTRSGDDIVAFATLQEATIPAGSTAVQDVPFAAVITGADANGLAGAGQMLDSITWVAAIQVDVPTSQGQDDETPEDYLDRLANLMRMVALRPILPQDFAILALQNDGVGRAVAMNLYNPADGTWTNERTVTLILTNPDGLPVASDVKQQVIDQLEALREVNWIVNVIDPTYDAVDVDFDVVAYAGQDEDTVSAAAAAAITAYLSPAAFRLGVMSPAIAGGEVIPPPDSGQPARRQWIYVNELIALLDRVLGVDRVVTVTINGAAVDYQLPDPYALPQPGAITGTVAGGTPSP
jgi:Baseplate J-like protein